MYTEVVVPHKNAPVLKFAKQLLGCLAAACILVGLLLFPLFLIPGAVFGLLFWLIYQKVDLEYQYYHLNDDLDLDKVIGNSRRKHIATIQMSQVVMVAPLNSPELNAYQSWPILDVSAGDPSQPPYVMACTVNGSNKKVLLQMNDALLKSLKKELRSKVIEG